jgi:hypothetical protein
MGVGVKASGLSLLVVVSMVIGGLITVRVVDDGPGTVLTTPTECLSRSQWCRLVWTVAPLTTRLRESQPSRTYHH